MLFELNQSFFFKYDEKDPTILFYHDNIYRFFENYRSFLHDRTLSLQIINGLKKMNGISSICVQLLFLTAI